MIPQRIFRIFRILATSEDPTVVAITQQKQIYGLISSGDNIHRFTVFTPNIRQ